MQKQPSSLSLKRRKFLSSSGPVTTVRLYEIYPTQYLLLSRHINIILKGGDGLVAARHLKLWGYQPSVYYPKPSSKPLFVGLETQLKNLEIEFINDLNSISNYQLIIDAIFGFSFKAGNIREPFKSVIDTVNKATQIPILSVDIPSGWDVDNGFLEGGIREPAVLVSLTAPKPVANCIDTTKTQHYVGGRFVGRAFAEKYGIDLYQYKGYDQVLKL